MGTNLGKAKLYVLALAGSLFVLPPLSYADRHGDHEHLRYHDHPSFGFHLSIYPDDYYSVWVGTNRYYYYDGLYYSRFGADYVLVQPPIGAVVAAVPPDFAPVVLNGITYYVNGGVYYVYTRHGYQVVPQPVAAVQAAPPAVVVATQPAPVAVAESQASVSAGSDDAYTINIPNDRGGYTPVTLKKSKDGFVGPQGELYRESPNVKQLRVLYGK